MQDRDLGPETEEDRPVMGQLKFSIGFSGANHDTDPGEVELYHSKKEWDELSKSEKESIIDQAVEDHVWTYADAGFIFENPEDDPDSISG